MGFVLSGDTQRRVVYHQRMHGNWSLVSWWHSQVYKWHISKIGLCIKTSHNYTITICLLFKICSEWWYRKLHFVKWKQTGNTWTRGCWWQMLLSCWRCRGTVGEYWSKQTNTSIWRTENHTDPQHIFLPSAPTIITFTYPREFWAHYHSRHPFYKYTHFLRSPSTTEADGQHGLTHKLFTSHPMLTMGHTQQQLRNRRERKTLDITVSTGSRTNELSRNLPF